MKYNALDIMKFLINNNKIAQNKDLHEVLYKAIKKNAPDQVMIDTDADDMRITFEGLGMSRFRGARKATDQLFSVITVIKDLEIIPF